MKRIFWIATLCAVLMTVLSLPAFSDTADEYISEQLEAAGADELYDSLSDETKELFERIGIDAINYEQIMNVSPETVFGLFFSLFSGRLGVPLGSMGVLAAVIIISSIIKNFVAGLNSCKADELYNVITAFVTGLIIIVPVGSCISDVAAAVELGADFMKLFIPVFIAVMIAAGKPLAAMSFNGMVFGLAEFITYVSRNFIMPVISAFLAFSLVGSFSTDIKLGNIISFSKKCIMTVMGFMSTVFVALLCMKGFISTAADTVGTKASKFLLGSFLPVVGTAMGEAMSTVRECLVLVRGSVGTFGMLAVMLTYVPVIISILAWQFMLFICSSLGEIMGLGSAVGVIKAISSTLTLLLAVLIFCTFLLVISIAVILMVAGR